MKIPDKFVPRSWEMPPGFRVLEESASVVTREFDGEKLDWLVALVETPPLTQPFLWMRPLDSYFDAGFCIAATNRWDLGIQKMGLMRSTEPFALRNSLTTVWKSNQMARRIVFNRRGQLRRENERAYEYLLFGADGLAAWFVNPNIKLYDEIEPIPFVWNLPMTNVEFLRLPALEIWAKLRELLADSQGETAFARRFARMNHKRRESEIFEKRHGTEQETEALLRTRLQRDGIWAEMPMDSNLPLKLDIYWGKCYWTIPGCKLSEPPQELVEDFRRVLRWFRPIKTEIINLLCVWQWVRSVERFEFQMFPPTAHEQLEASVLWREWKANHEKI